MTKPRNHGLKRIKNASVYSWKGLCSAYKHEEAFRQELILLLISIPLALWLGQTGIEKALLISGVLLILIVELINSAIEATIDRIGSEWNEYSGRAKDIGSAAVLIAIVNAICIWSLILIG